MNLFEQFEENLNTGKLAWLNQPKSWRVADNRLIVDTLPNSNFFNDPETEDTVATGHYLYTIARGDFCMMTRVEIGMVGMFDSGCLLAMSDLHHWGKLCFENWLDEPSIVSVTTNGRSDDCPSLRIGKVSPYLRIVRSGDCFCMHYSLNAQDWTIIRYFRLSLPQEIKVGVLAQSPVGDGCRVIFDRFELEQRPIASAKML